MSGKLGTKSVDDTPKESTPKTLKPGNYSAKVNQVTLKSVPFKVGGYYVVLHIEGPDLGADFEGWAIDKSRPELGKAKGQIGTVKNGIWPYSDAEVNGRSIVRDDEILKFIKGFCRAIGSLDWFENQDGKHNTIEEFVQALNNDAPFKDKWLNWCIAGKEYLGKGNYINYDLFLPKPQNKGEIPFELENIESGKLIQYNPSIHIEKMKENKSVQSFDTKADSQIPGNDIIMGNSDLEL